MHVDGEEAVDHRLAPFDIGSTNPATSLKNANMLYAYLYTHKNKQGLPSPRVLGLDVRRFISIEPTGEEFDPVELTDLHLKVASYDYRDCKFAVLPNRDWYLT